MFTALAALDDDGEEDEDEEEEEWEDWKSEDGTEYVKFEIQEGDEWHELALKKDVDEAGDEGACVVAHLYPDGRFELVGDDDE
jgi:hypothetical protein